MFSFEETWHSDLDSQPRFAGRRAMLPVSSLNDKEDLNDVCVCFYFYIYFLVFSHGHEFTRKGRSGLSWGLKTGFLFVSEIWFPQRENVSHLLFTCSDSMKLVLQAQVVGTTLRTTLRWSHNPVIRSASKQINWSLEWTLFRRRGGQCSSNSSNVPEQTWITSLDCAFVCSCSQWCFFFFF